MNADTTLDTNGLMCPMPIVKLSKAMKSMDAGKILLLLSDDEGAKEDVPAWCNRTGNELMDTDQDGNVHKFYIKKS